MHEARPPPTRAMAPTRDSGAWSCRHDATADEDPTWNSLPEQSGSSQDVTRRRTSTRLREARHRAEGSRFSVLL